MPLEHIYNNNKLPCFALVATITSHYHMSQTELDRTNSAMNELDSSVSLFLLWGAIFSIIILALVNIAHKLETLKMQGLSIPLSSQLPCRKCIFFNKNEYLKCAVNPSIVFTQQALDCSDYRNLEDCAANNTSSQVKTRAEPNESRNYS